MIRFSDQNGYTVEWSYNTNPFGQEPQHVLVICRYNKMWLLTKHKTRGLEFPGGKRENQESLEDAANREVFEETGGITHSLKYIGQYRVNDPSKTFVKAVYFSEIDELVHKPHYFETGGPHLVKDLEDRNINPQFSFVMKDDVITECLKFIEQNNLNAD